MKLIERDYYLNALHDETQHDGIRIVDIARWLSTSQK